VNSDEKVGAKKTDLLSTLIDGECHFIECSEDVLEAENEGQPDDRADSLL
jgi:hypothetical protein